MTWACLALLFAAEEKGGPLLALRAHEGWVACVAFSPDGKRIAVAGGQGGGEGKPTSGRSCSRSHGRPRTRSSSRERGERP